MKHILIGTAGHVDHGKTALIRALTGIETDRLAEEKTRGITIDLGFAHMSLPGGEKVSIVDVPGHEKFIKNMLACAGGIDPVLLVIAADDGVMPQTREHLGILQLLRAKAGIIVLTKCDLVDEEWQALIHEDITTAVKDTFLKDAPIIPVSSHTGQGIGQLKDCIQEKIEQTAARNTFAPFRIPVDRVFSAEGFGTVITGTLIEGSLSQGDGIIVYPAGTPGRVRSLQVHSSQVETAYAGQRVAVNISGLRKEDMQRGHVLAPEGTISPTRMLDVKLSMIKDSTREIKTGSRLHFHYGTHSTLCKAQLIGGGKLTPGQESFAQLRFAEEIAVKAGDSFVVRFYSPIETIGGGVVLNTAPKKYRKGRTAETLNALKSLEKGDIGTQLCQAIISQGGIALLGDMQKRFSMDADAWAQEISGLTAKGQASIIGTHIIEGSYREALGAKMASTLKDFHDNNPLQAGMRKEELRSRILPGYKPGFFDEFTKLYSKISIAEGRVALCSFKISYTKEQSLVREAILDRLKQGGYTPPGMDELLAVNKKIADKILDALLAEGAVISTEPGIVFDAETVRQAKDSFRDLATHGGGCVTLAQFRDKVQTSRKYALSLLEYFDRVGFTRKDGDGRVLGNIIDI
ncbi:MAG: selenocysteine-specific translation elongation factor [Defluviitaleaceae bacterium]|nr:selenocysteine-specific translation elongation factor [Defluviitaleaceae bacterium]